MRSHSPTKVIANKSDMRNYLPPSSLGRLKSSVLVAYSPKTNTKLVCLDCLKSATLELLSEVVVMLVLGMCARKFCFVLRRTSPTTWGEDMLCCGVARVDLRCCLASQKLSSYVNLSKNIRIDATKT